jgi:hypothetical protein
MIHGTVLASFAVEDFSLDGLLRPTEVEFQARERELLAMRQV